MRDGTLKSFVTGVLLRKPALRAFAKEGVKLSLCVLATIGAVVAMRRFHGEPWVPAYSYDLSGALFALAAMWCISAVRTISAAYREFADSHEKR